jgi:hypothetical protein
MIYSIVLSRRVEFTERVALKVRCASEEELAAVDWDTDPAALRLSDRQLDWDGGESEYTYYPTVIEGTADGEVDVDLTLSDEEYEAAS